MLEEGGRRKEERGRRKEERGRRKEGRGRREEGGGKREKEGGRRREEETGREGKWGKLIDSPAQRERDWLEKQVKSSQNHSVAKVTC